jgi:hypothetical protein
VIRTTITADAADISLHLPDKYIGKKLEVLLYSIDEVSEERLSENTINNSSFRGALHLTEEQYEDFQQHAKDIRAEWNRDI